MRKQLLLLLGILIALPAVARDFSYEYNGQTLTYSVIDEEAKTCRVAKNTGVSGTLILPSHPKDGDSEFTLTEIAERAFSGCNSLTSVVIPPSVTTLGEDAFWPCTGLTKSAYPEHLDNPFEWGLTFKYPTAATITDDGVVYDAAMTTLYFAPYTLTGEFSIAPTTTTIKAQTLLDCNALNKIIVPASVTLIENQAFKGCGFLSEVIFEDGESSVDYSNDAFDGCAASKLYMGRNINCGLNSTTSLLPYISSVTIGNCVTEIPDYAFYGSSLSSAIIGNSIRTIGESAFAGCSSLASVDIPDSVTSIGKSAFCDCSSLVSIKIPDAVTVIDDYTFSGCSSMAYVSIGNSVSHIGKNAFSGCSALTSVTIPSSVTTIWNSAFDGCDNMTTMKLLCEKPPLITGLVFANQIAQMSLPNTTLEIQTNDIVDLAEYFGLWHFKTIIVNGNPTKSYSIGGITYCLIENPDNREAVILGSESNSVINIPERITDLSDPDNPIRYYVRAIAPQAFRENQVKSITFDSRAQIANIPQYAFFGCTYLTSISIPNSVTEIGESAFKCCSALTSVTIGNSVAYIGKQAFVGCSGLTSVTIPNSVTYIDDYAFTTPSIKELIIEDGETPIYIGWFPLGYINYDDESSFETLYIGRTWTCPEYDMGYSSFPRSLKTVTIGNQVKRIPNCAFLGCWNVTSIELPDSVTSIGDWAFYYMRSLTSINIPDFVTSIGRGAFSRCYGITSFLIPNSVTSIGEYAFESCKMKWVVIPNSVTSIGEYAFKYCNDLNWVVIGSSVTSIGENAFSGCNFIYNIYSLNPEPPIIGENNLESYGSSVYVPGGSLEKYKSAPGWNRFNFFYDLNSQLGLATASIVGMAKGETSTFKVTTYQNLAEPGSDRWKSDNEAVATVDKEGIVTAVATGTANISCTLKTSLGWEYSTAYELVVITYRGDANGDDILAVNDVVLTARAVVNDIDPSLLLWAVDFNHDNRVTVGELSREIDAVVSYTAPAQASGRHYLRALQAAGMASPLSLSMDGSDVTVAMGGDGRFAGLQFDVVGDDGLTVTSVTLCGDATRSHSAANHRLETGALRMLAYGTESLEPDGAFATIHTESADLKPRKLTLTNVMAGDSDGRLYRLPDSEINFNHILGIDNVANGGLSIAVEGRTLIITSDAETSVTITDMRGLSTRLEVSVGVTRHTLPAPGIYVVNNHKIIIR